MPISFCRNEVPQSTTRIPSSCSSAKQFAPISPSPPSGTKRRRGLDTEGTIEGSDFHIAEPVSQCQRLLARDRPRIGAGIATKTLALSGFERVRQNAGFDWKKPRGPATFPGEARQTCQHPRAFLSTKPRNF